MAGLDPALFPMPGTAGTATVVPDPAQTPPTPAAPLAPTPPAPVAHTTPAPVSAYHANVEHGSFDDDSIKTGDFDAYKGTKGRIDRIGFLNPRAITFGRTHFVEANGKKGYFLCDSTFAKQGGQEVPTHQAACCQKLGPPKKRFAALIAVYGTDAIGKLSNPFSYLFKVWRFNEQLFDSLRTINRALSLLDHDIFAKLIDDQYNKYELTPLADCVLMASGAKESTFGQEADAYVAAMTPRLDRTVGYANTPAEWAQVLGHVTMPGMPGGTPGVGGLVTDTPIQDIAQLLQGRR